MKPHRNFRFKNKTEMFACVGFRYDQPQSIEYVQRKDAKSIVATVQRLLEMEDGADVISIRRVYLEHDKTEKPPFADLDAVQRHLRGESPT